MRVMDRAVLLEYVPFGVGVVPYKVDRIQRDERPTGYGMPVSFRR